MPRLAALASLLLLALTAAAAPPAWQISITQEALNGRALDKPTRIDCPQSGCEAPVTLLVGDKHQHFLAGFTFVASGAYLSLQALEPGLGKVIGFSDGYEGPIFIMVRGARSDQLLRFTLSGVPNAPGTGPALMDNTHSLVFHRKLDPDLSLRIDLRKPRPTG
jgi:hypothetical protein